MARSRLRLVPQTDPRALRVGIERDEDEPSTVVLAVRDANGRNATVRLPAESAQALGASLHVASRDRTYSHDFRIAAELTTGDPRR